MADKQRSTNRTITENRKAFHDYFIEESLEAGIELCGTEVKALRRGGVNLKDAWCSVVEGEMFINGMHISPYEQGNIFNRDPLRRKKLLMHKKEILKLQQYTQRDGYTLVPLSLYFSGANVKMEVGLCKGKKLWDKRESDAKAEAGREIERYAKSKNRSGRDD